MNQDRRAVSRGVRQVTAVTVTLIALVVTASLPASAPACTCPVRSDADIISLAVTGLGSPYRWGHAQWSTTDRDWGGADCSGYVVKAWQVPRGSSIKEDYHPYGTWHLFTDTTHWYAISRGSANFADIVGYTDPDGSGPASGHVVMYSHGDPYGLALVYEAPRTGLDIRRVWKDVSASKWRFRRRHNLTRSMQLALAGCAGVSGSRAPAPTREASVLLELPG